MRITILGSGTCRPDADRLPSGYWIEAGPARIRLDCGPGTVHGGTRHAHVDWASQTHMLISHFHIDHVCDLPMLLFAFKHGREPAPRGPLTFLGPAGLRELVEGFDKLLSTNLLNQAFPVEFVELADGSAFELPEGAGTVRALRVPHTASSLAYRIEADGAALGYTGDTSPEWERLPEFLRDVDLLIAECSHMEPAGTPHLTLDDVCRLAVDSGARRLLTVHHYFDLDRESLAERLREALPGVDAAPGHDGLTVTL